MEETKRSSDDEILFELNVLVKKREHVFSLATAIFNNAKKLTARHAEGFKIQLKHLEKLENEFGSIQDQIITLNSRLGDPKRSVETTQMSLNFYELVWTTQAKARQCDVSIDSDAAAPAASPAVPLLPMQVPNFDAPPSDLSPPNYNESERDAEMIIRTEDEVQDVASAHSHTFCHHGPDEPKPSSPNPSLQFPIVKEPSRVRLASGTNDGSGSDRTTIGPPPSYSFVMKQKRRFLKPFQSTSEVVVSDRPPPPTYPGIRGLYRPTESGQMERICNIPSFSDPIWRSRSQPALCRRCGVLVSTTTHSHNSIATHAVVLALCLFGCWPCCLLPYCMNSCKNTYHHCPICHGFLGTYTPW